MKVWFVPATIKRKVPGWRDIIVKSSDPRADDEHIAQSNFDSYKWMDWVYGSMMGNRKAAHYPERLFAAFLYMNGVDFISQAPFRVTKMAGYSKVYFADFYIPEEHTIVEIDGKEHQGKRTAKKDRLRDEDLLDMGIKTIRVPNAIVFRQYTLLDLPFIK